MGCGFVGKYASWKYVSEWSLSHTEILEEGCGFVGCLWEAPVCVCVCVCAYVRAFGRAVGMSTLHEAWQKQRD